MKLIMESWRGYLGESDDSKKELTSDEFVLFLFSKELNDLLLENLLNEGEYSLETKIKKLMKKYAIPFGIAAAILAGTGVKGAADIAQNIYNQPAQSTQQVKKSKSPFASQLPPGYSDLSDQQGIEKAWKAFDKKGYEGAPVSGALPTTKGRKAYIHVPASKIDPGDVLPMSLMTAGDYRKFIEDQFMTDNPRDIVYLKRMVYGTPSKWLSGSGNSNFKFVEGHPVLPPEWSITRDVFARVMGEKLDMLEAYVEEDPANREKVASKLGIDQSQLESYFHKQRFEIK